MSIETILISQFRQLSSEDQKKVMDFVETLAKASPSSRQNGSSGLPRPHVIPVSQDVIDKARREYRAKNPEDSR